MGFKSDNSWIQPKGEDLCYNSNFTAACVFLKKNCAKVMNWERDLKNLHCFHKMSWKCDKERSKNLIRFWIQDQIDCGALSNSNKWAPL